MKDTTIIYNSIVEKCERLDDAQFGKLMRAALIYSASGEVTDFEDPLVAFAFDSLKVDIDANNEKYEKAKKLRQEAGRKGGLAKASNAKQSQAEDSEASNAKQEVAEDSNASNAKQDLANVASSSVSVSVSDSVSDTVSVSVKNKTKREGKKSCDFTPPTYEEVISYCYTHNLRIDTRTFFEYYQSQGWCKSKGQKVKDWKACARAWASREAEYPRKTKSTVEKVLDFQAAQANQGRGT